MFEKFTVRAGQAVVQAGEEARVGRHDYIGTEHLLLGLIANNDDPVAQMLETLGSGVAVIRRTVEEVAPPGPVDVHGHIPFTPRAKAALERTLHEADLAGHEHIDAEHILCALCSDTESSAAKALVGAGIPPVQVRDRVRLSWGR